MRLTIPEEATIRIEPPADPEIAYQQFCEVNPELHRVEQTSEGEIVVTPPAGNESSYRNFNILLHLGNWNHKEHRGYCFGPDTVFVLPDNSKKGADATWIRREAVASASIQRRKKFMRVVPDFIIELKSPTDRLPALHRKMKAWLAKGVPLGWLIDADAQQGWVYMQNNVEHLKRPLLLHGVGPIEGFVLPMEELYQGLI